MLLEALVALLVLFLKKEQRVMLEAVVAHKELVVLVVEVQVVVQLGLTV